MTKYTSLKYLVIVFVLMIINSLIVALIHIAPIKQIIFSIIMTLFLTILPIYLMYILMIDKYISYRHVINIIVFLYWFMFILGIICYIGQYFDIGFINNFFESLSASRLLKAELADKIMRNAHGAYSFGLPRLDVFFVEPTHYASCLYMFFPVTCTVVLTDLALDPNNFKTLIACLFMAAIERSNGVFLSKASPPYEQNAVGIHKHVPLINA